MRKEVLIPKKEKKKKKRAQQSRRPVFCLRSRRTGKLRPATGQVSGPGGAPGLLDPLGVLGPWSQSALGAFGAFWHSVGGAARSLFLGDQSQ